MGAMWIGKLGFSPFTYQPFFLALGWHLFLKLEIECHTYLNSQASTLQKKVCILEFTVASH